MSVSKENNFSGSASEIEAAKEKFEVMTFKSGSRAMDYMLFKPETEEGKLYPLVVYLHGAGERGNDPHMTLANSGGYTFAQASWQKKHPCYIICPQVAPGELWTDDTYQKLIPQLISALGRELHFPIDSARIYITGLSMGGAGTFKAISLHPELYAAAMPICGAGDPFEVRNAKDVPVWAFHAEDDPVVACKDYCKGGLEGAAGTSLMVDSLRGAGNQQVRYTEYPTGWLAEQGIGFPHASWVPAYEDEEAKEWMFAQNKNDRYEIHLIAPGFYWIEDSMDDSIYIIEGKEKALVIDTGMAENDFIGMVESVTRLPYELALTHNHPDHNYHLDKFERYYMNERDTVLFGFSSSGKDFSKAKLMPVKDGDVIDLGGDYEVEVFDIPGHTPGSVAFLDRKRGIMLTGDALGVWMQVPNALCISEYKKSLEHFLERISAPEYQDICMLAGHKKQEGGPGSVYGSEYNPNNKQRVKDMIALCEKVLEKDIEFTRYPFEFGRPAYVATYGHATMVFSDDVVK